MTAKSYCFSNNGDDGRIVVMKETQLVFTFSKSTTETPE